MKEHHRKSIRLNGFDYSQPGEYFVTLCTRDRVCILGEIVGGSMRLSETGRLVEKCWNQIPVHFTNTRVDILQIMPNHLHGIVEISEQRVQPPPNARPVGVEYIQPLQSQRGGLLSPRRHHYQHVVPKSLSSIIRSFKAAATRAIYLDNRDAHSTIWQRGYYDHIIRDAIDRFFVEQYISLNPIMWELDKDNPKAGQIPIEELEKMLREERDLDGHAVQKVIEHELGYRQWSEKTHIQRDHV